MQKTNKLALTLFFFFCVGTLSYSQTNRTLPTKVADILAQMPTKSIPHTNTLMERIIELKKEGIVQLCNMLVPLGTGNDTSVRYAINSLAIHVSKKDSDVDKMIVEDALLEATKKTTNNEVKTFLIERLHYCGGNASVPVLENYLYKDAFYKPALYTLTAIGGEKASQIILEALKNSDGKKQLAYIASLGELKYDTALPILEKLSYSMNALVRQKSLNSLAEIASPRAYNAVYNAAKNANFLPEKTNAVLSFIRFGMKQENLNLKKKIAKALLKNSLSEAQLHYRTAGLKLLNKEKGTASTKRLLKEFRHQNTAYRGAVLEIASKNLTNKNLIEWSRSFKKTSSEGKAQILNAFRKSDKTAILPLLILPGMENKDQMVWISSIKALAYQPKNTALPLLIDALKKAKSPLEFSTIKESLLRISSSNEIPTIANYIEKANNNGKAILIDVLAAKKAKSEFSKIYPLLRVNNNQQVRSAIYKALPNISREAHLLELISLLKTTENQQYIKNTQEAITTILGQSKGDLSDVVLEAYKNAEKKEKLLPTLVALNNGDAFSWVMSSLKSTNINERQKALEVLSKWKSNEALEALFNVASANTSLRSKALRFYLSQVNRSNQPADQKLLLIKKIMPYTKGVDEQKEVIKAVQKIKTFLSLVFVSNYVDKKELSTTASKAVINIALPSPGKNNGLSGNIVRKIILKSIKNISGPDSQYIKIDVTEFLDKMTKDKGFESLFNGYDLQGWEGLVKNPIARAKMSKTQLEDAQKKANAQMLKDWYVKDGIIGFKGEGYNNICTIKDYGDFEMLVDWKITNGGDSGIYLRGTPQVQIWDTAKTEVGAQVGSGGLYNNKKNKSTPLVVADNPINDWNTFRIKMIGERVTVHLNGILVTDNVILENYWDRKLPIFTKEAIELQAHGEDLGFRNVYIREISSGEELLAKEEIKEGFVSLFNGKDLDHWIGNKKDYLVENNELIVRPKQGGHGNLFTAEEYSDFNFRFEFKLTPDANNGLGIHAPLTGDAAYVGKELQILDNTAPIYANLEDYQYHGSVYGVIPAKKGFLKPVGQWNFQEVMVKGNHIKITLNGTVIVDGNWKKASINGTLDKKNHPGLKRNNGHIGFLGHGSEVSFRKIRIKNLKKE